MRDAHEWLTVDEVAERFRRSPHTIRRWLRAGRFGAGAEKLPSGGWLVRSDAVFVPAGVEDTNRDLRV